MEKNEVGVLLDAVNAVIVGKKEQVRLLVIALLADGHVLLEDVPGVGKTTLAKTVAKACELSYGRIQFTPDTLPSDVTGVSVYHRKTEEFYYQPGVIMNHIVLADEINRTSPKTQASLLEAMEEKQVTVDGIVHKIQKPFFVIATQNPTNFLGTYNLPEAQLDRFLMRLSLGYPEPEEERMMVKNFIGHKGVEEVNSVITREQLLKMQQQTERVFIHEDLIDYIITVINRTRSHQYVTLGASPRATLAVIRAARAAAFINERDFVIPDDIREVIYAVLSHRLVLSAEARMNHRDAKDVITNILISVEVPVLKSYS